MKKLLSILTVFILSFSLVACGGSEPTDAKKEDTKQEQKKEENKDTKQEQKNKENEKKQEEVKIEEEKVMPRENLIGKSNKNFKDLSKSTPREVRNDVTGNLRLETISKSCNIEEYALSYYKEHFGSDQEIHAIVNFSTNTTTRISNIGEFIEVVVFEYVPKEEHDAKKLFGGMKLGHYWVYKDNGDIEKIK
ncbi:hypothetical protein [Clostridium tetani]|uniref:hypothetical protein n=1 Tax=Clostridium tetani TaxID=1513 RepID=UPI00068E76DD|nr:hypothetical protein [Clostridium tetani]